MNITLKEMKLKFIDNNDGTWSKVITDMDDNLILEELNLMLLPEMLNEKYFNEWENQIKNSPSTNIVEVERFI